jgi:group I intron endonuclease
MAYRKFSGIYIIQSIEKPDRVYVGSTTCMKGRWITHKLDLRANRHHSRQLQYHYNKYGEADLVFEVIESGDYICKEHLLSREQGWFFHFKYKNKDFPYFNCAHIAGSRMGVKGSEREKEILRQRMIGNTYVKGKHWTLSEEAKQRRRESNLGEKNPNFGKKASQKTRDKMSKTRRGVPNFKKRGRKLSEEHRLKISRGLFLFYQNKKK